MVGYHAEKYEVSKNQMQRNNFPSNSLNDMDAGGASTQTNDGLSRELAMLSYFGRINYDFAGKYLLEANFRADASSRFCSGTSLGDISLLSPVLGVSARRSLWKVRMIG